MGIASSNMVIAAWALIGVYVAATLFLVIRGALKTKTLADYAVGNITFSPVFVGLSLAASMTSAATFIIAPGLIALYGISGFIASSLVMPIACLGSLYFLTKGFHKYGQTVKANTMAQWIGSRYKSKAYSLFIGFTSLLLITFIVLILVGVTKVLSKSLNLNEIYVLVGITLFIFGYMIFGGANSMVYTNAIQAILMLIVAVILITSGYEHFSDGVSGFLAKLKAIDPNLISTTNPKSFLFRDYFEIVFCQIIVGIAVVCQPHILTKSLLLKSKKDINKFLFVNTIVMTIFFMVIITGLYARIAFPDFTVNGTALRPDGIVAAYVIQQFPVFVAIIVVMGLMAAGISTLEGLILSVSTTITSDIIRPIFGKLYQSNKNSGQLEVKINKFVIIALAGISLYIAYDQLINPRLSVIILAQNGVYIFFASAFVPVLFGTFFNNVPKFVAMSASITAVIVHLTIYYGEFTPYMQNVPIKNPGIASAIAILSSAFVGMVGLIYFRVRERQSKITNDSIYCLKHETTNH